MRRSVLSFLLAVALAPAFAPAASAAGSINRDRRGVAIRGYDPVAYFTENKAVKGDPRFTATVAGTTYHFAPAAYRDRFVTDPARYQPRYGGYCVFGVAQGGKFGIDPTAFSIIDGKLYLNLDHDVRAQWRKDVPAFIERADKQWPTLARQSCARPRLPRARVAPCKTPLDQGDSSKSFVATSGVHVGRRHCHHRRQHRCRTRAVCGQVQAQVRRRRKRQQLRRKMRWQVWCEVQGQVRRQVRRQEVMAVMRRRLAR